MIDNSTPVVTNQEQHRRVTRAVVKAALERLNVRGMPVTRRAVREEIGGFGSMTTINAILHEFGEITAASTPPAYEMSEQLRLVIDEMLKNIFAVCVRDVSAIGTRREEILLNRVKQVEATAKDQAEMADAAIQQAHASEAQAAAAMRAAQSEAAVAQGKAQEASQAVEQANEELSSISGQMLILRQNRDGAVAAQASAEETLARTELRLETERAGRLAALAVVRDLEAELNLRSADIQALEQRQHERLIDLSNDLAASRSAQSELATSRDRLEHEKAEMRAAISKATETIICLKSDLATANQLILGLTETNRGMAAQYDQTNHMLVEANRRQADIDNILDLVRANTTAISQIAQIKPE